MFLNCFRRFVKIGLSFCCVLSVGVGYDAINQSTVQEHVQFDNF